jgi:hypothetical protein
MSAERRIPFVFQARGIRMISFGCDEFTHCSVPLAFDGRYFILEPSYPTPLISVVLELQGEPVFEVKRNRPVANPYSNVSMSPSGVVTASDRLSGQPFYAIRPGVGHEGGIWNHTRRRGSTI